MASMYTGNSILVFKVNCNWQYQLSVKLYFTFKYALQILLKREYCIVRKSGLLAGLLALSLATLFSSFWDFI